VLCFLFQDDITNAITSLGMVVSHSEVVLPMLIFWIFVNVPNEASVELSAQGIGFTKHCLFVDNIKLQIVGCLLISILVQ
jgi:hypothetical protein